MRRLAILLIFLLVGLINAMAQGPILGGELSNSAVTSVADIDEVMPRMKALGLNTVLVPVYWEMMEPEEGQFDFTLIDRTIRQTRDLQLKGYSYGLAHGRTRCRAMRPCGSNRTPSVSHDQELKMANHWRLPVVSQNRCFRQTTRHSRL